MRTGRIRQAGQGQRPLAAVVGVLVSDVHLSLRPPLARSQEPDWLKAMAGVWDQVKALAEHHDCPVLCAGDIFDRWNAPAELINWALENLPHLYAIPGNHDLPGHRQDLAHRSAYGTLVRARKITEAPAEGVGAGALVIYGKPFNGPVPKRRKDGALCLHVLLVHQYLWIPGSVYQGAPPEARLGKVARQFRAFDAVVVGDNHKGFMRRLKNGTHLINCGTLLRRKSDEDDYRPAVGLLHQDGKISQHFLDTTGDVLVPTAPAGKNSKVQAFVAQLGRVELSSLDFREQVLATLRDVKVSKRTRGILLEAMGE